MDLNPEKSQNPKRFSLVNDMISSRNFSHVHVSWSVEDPKIFNANKCFLLEILNFQETRFSDRAVEYRYFLRVHYLEKETSVYAETFRIF